MGNKQTKVQNNKPCEKQTDIIENDLRIVRTYFNTPRNRAVLQVETHGKNMKIDRVDQLYFVTIRDRGLRTLENSICTYSEAMAKVTNWVEQYDCKIYKMDTGPLKKRNMSAAF